MRLKGFVSSAKQYRLFIATNQAGIGKGLYTEDDYAQLTAWMVRCLEASGVFISGVYYCPHHPEATVIRYRIACHCRKPKSGLLKRIQDDHNIDLRRSWLIGDKTSDIAAGAALGMRTMLVRTGYAGKDGQWNMHADVITDNLRSAADHISRIEEP